MSAAQPDAARRRPGGASMSAATKTRKREVSPAERERRREAAKAKQAALLDELHAKVETFAESAEWLRYLAFAARFRTYSINNQMLIYVQRPEAVRVAGFRKWEEMGRRVRKGSKGIAILAPHVGKRDVADAATGEVTEDRYTYFRAVYVFDVADTDPIDGAENVYDPADDASIVTLLDGDDDGGLYERIAAWLTSSGWTVRSEELPPGGPNGYTTTDGSRRVVVALDRTPAQRAKTLAHEAGHVVLHTSADDAKGVVDYHTHRGMWETEAESVAYVLAGLAGLDTSGYSVGYVTGWAHKNGTGVDVDMVKATAGRVMDAVREIAEGVGL